MRAVEQVEFGAPEVLQLAERAKPALSHGQALIKVKACGVNRADLLQRRGAYAPPKGESEVLGLEVSGEVVELADDVSGWAVGDRVCGLVAGGAYAEYCIVDAGMLLPIPEGLSYTQAAAIPEAFLTAMQAVDVLGELPEAGSILIHAGASGVGSAALQLAKLRSATVWFTAGSEHKIKHVLDLGADKGINYKQQSFREVVLEDTQEQGVDVVVDFIGASYLDDNLHCLKKGGRLIHIGMLGGSRAEIDLRHVIYHRLQLKGLIMRSRSIEEKRHMVQQFAERYLPLFDQGKLVPVVDVVYPMEQVVEAHCYMEGNKNIGKIILSW